jgi:site-specific DNA-cytosine methylase
VLRFHEELRTLDVVPRPLSDILVMGFSCKNISGLNNKPMSERGNSGSSAETLRGLLDYLKALPLQSRPHVLILENVKRLAQHREAFAGLIACKHVHCRIDLKHIHTSIWYSTWFHSLYVDIRGQVDPNDQCGAEALCSALKEEGYVAKWFSVSSDEFFLPQSRARVWILALRTLGFSPGALLCRQADLEAVGQAFLSGKAHTQNLHQQNW